TPLHRLEQSMHGLVYYIIVPVFAFANSGIDLEAETLGSITDPLGLGVILGLAVGKPLGIFSIVFLLNKMKLVELPEGVTLRNILGAGMLAGVGFTMSLFISELAFSEGVFLDQAKLGI